jgi:hypothetical protein
MTSQIKTKSVLKASTDIITNIPACPIGLAEILAIMSVSTFKISVILYLALWNKQLNFILPESENKLYDVYILHIFFLGKMS